MELPENPNNQHTAGYNLSHIRHLYLCACDVKPEIAVRQGCVCPKALLIRVRLCCGHNISVVALVTPATLCETQCVVVKTIQLWRLQIGM